MMNVNLEKELVDYMHTHDHDVITLKLVHDAFSDYHYLSMHPSIRYKRPKHEERFEKFEIGDITVYVEKHVKTTHDELTFVDEKLLGIHRCHVVGLDLKVEDNLFH